MKNIIKIWLVFIVCLIVAVPVQGMEKKVVIETKVGDDSKDLQAVNELSSGVTELSKKYKEQVALNSELPDKTKKVNEMVLRVCKKYKELRQLNTCLQLENERLARELADLAKKEEEQRLVNGKLIEELQQVRQQTGSSDVRLKEIAKEKDSFQLKDQKNEFNKRKIFLSVLFLLVVSYACCKSKIGPQFLLNMFKAA